MKETSQEAVLLKHYRNIKELSLQQLAALKKGNVTDINECIAQKQLIIDRIIESQQEVDMAGFGEDTVKALLQLLTDITAQEEESQKLLSAWQTSVRGQIVVAQQEKNLHEAYEGPLLTGYVVDRRE